MSFGIRFILNFGRYHRFARRTLHWQWFGSKLWRHKDFSRREWRRQLGSLNLLVTLRLIVNRSRHSNVVINIARQLRFKSRMNAQIIFCNFSPTNTTQHDENYSRSEKARSERFSFAVSMCVWSNNFFQFFDHFQRSSRGLNFWQPTIFCNFLINKQKINLRFRFLKTSFFR